MLLGSLPAVVALAAAGRLEQARMKLFHPIGFMLASPVQSTGEAIARFTEEIVQEKAAEERAEGKTAEEKIAQEKTNVILSEAKDLVFSSLRSAERARFEGARLQSSRRASKRTGLCP